MRWALLSPAVDWRMSQSRPRSQCHAHGSNEEHAKRSERQFARHGARYTELRTPPMHESGFLADLCCRDRAIDAVGLELDKMRPGLPEDLDLRQGDAHGDD